MPAKGLLALLTLLPVLATAGEWHVYGRSADGQAFLYVDVSSLSTHGSARRAWFQELRADGSAQMVLYAFRCAAREYASVSRREVDPDGQLRQAGKAARLVYAPVPPDSVAADMLAIACAATPAALAVAEMGGEPVDGDPRDHARRVRAAQAAERGAK